MVHKALNICCMTLYRNSLLTFDLYDTAQIQASYPPGGKLCELLATVLMRIKEFHKITFQIDGKYNSLDKQQSLISFSLLLMKYPN
jgi:hypothetical protein